MKKFRNNCENIKKLNISTENYIKKTNIETFLNVIPKLCDNTLMKTDEQTKYIDNPKNIGINLNKDKLLVKQ